MKRRDLIDLIHGILATGHGCYHPRYGFAECERIARAIKRADA